MEAGALQPGEAVVTLVGGTTATVAWVHAIAGQADMYNLTVANDHTYAVGRGHVVVHNTGSGPCGLSGTVSEGSIDGLYRGDSRSPDEIFANGFKPRGSSADLEAHLMSKLEDTAYVSTSKSMEVAGIYAAGYDNGYVYKVVASGEDINALMEQGLYTFNQGFAWEQEVAVLGGIPNSDVVGAWQVIGGDGVVEELRFGPFIPNPFFTG